MKIAIDCKNQALYGGGIAHWLSDVLPPFLEACQEDEVTLISPKCDGARSLTFYGKEIKLISWPKQLPLSIRHGLYDNLFFPSILSNIKPDLIFSPYHDVRMPRNIPSVITVHDLCYDDVPDCYSGYLRNYRLMLLRTNLNRAKHIITVSNTTRERLMIEQGLTKESISIVPNSLSVQFLTPPPSKEIIDIWRRDHGAIAGDNSFLLLYSGGIEPRKNLPNLFSALRLLWNQGEKITLLITGNSDYRWSHLLPQLNNLSNYVRFLGRLTLEQLRLAYEAVDAVVYPTLCEGFGRVCIEAMVCGTPLACSDLPVFREVAGRYPYYFNPLDINNMSKVIIYACRAGKQTRYNDGNFTPSATREAFLDAMMPIVAEIRNKGY